MGKEGISEDELGRGEQSAGIVERARDVFKNHMKKE
jgi:hypothetical protein